MAAYAWNPEKYDSEKAWRDAMKNLLPNAAAELEAFATHNSDLGANGHGYRRDESVALQPVAQRFIESFTKQNRYESKDFDTLSETFGRMVEAADILMTDTENPALIAEMKPWLIQHKLTGETGREVLAMIKAAETADRELFVRKHKHVKALQQQMFDVDQTYNQNPYQPGVKTAEKVIKPLIDKIFTESVERYNQTYGTRLDAKTNYMPHTLTSDVNQIKHIPLRQKTNRILVSPANEVIKWQGKGYMTIELDKTYPALGIDINLGKPEVAAWGVLEVSTDGKEWKKVDFKQDKNRVYADLQKAPVKMVRFTNTDSQEQEVYLRQFMIIVEK